MNERLTYFHRLRYGPQSYQEDYAHENGNYLNTCILCKEHFLGHKRRVCCKVCTERPIEDASATVSEDPEKPSL